MQRLVAKLWRWWPLRRAAPEPRVPYEVACACGQVLTGLRRRDYQAPRCGHCSNTVFVLPFSPFAGALAAGDGQAAAVLTPPHRSARRLWGLPLAAIGLTLAIVVVIFYFLLTRLGTPPETAREPIGPHLAAAQQYLAEGNFRLAVNELEIALRDEQTNSSLAPGQRQLLRQLHRQAVLLADLSAESVEEIVRHAAGTPEAEWQREFAQRYQGKSVILDGEVSVKPAGELEGGPEFLRVNGKEVRLDLSSLQLLHGLREHLPARLIFAARLAGVDREANAWVVRLQPDSGVLLTDEAAVAICCPALREDAHEILTRQATWLKD
jgi:hypothetical protein